MKIDAFKNRMMNSLDFNQVLSCISKPRPSLFAASDIVGFRSIRNKVSSPRGSDEILRHPNDRVDLAAILADDLSCTLLV